MIEKISLLERCWYYAKIKVPVFSRKPSKTEKDKVVKFMVNKNVQSNKNLSK